MLSRKQDQILNQIEEVFKKKPNCFYVEGPMGVGKSVIIDVFSKNVSNDYDWCVYKFEGKNGTSSAFATLKNNEAFKVAQSKLTTLSLNISVPLMPFGINSAFQEISLFDPKEHFILKQLMKTSASNILIIADSFQYWDSNSASFLIDLKNQVHKLKSKNICILFVFDQQEGINENKMSFRELTEKIIRIEKVDIKELKEMLDIFESPSSSTLVEAEIEFLQAISAGDLKIVKWLLEGHFWSESEVPSSKITRMDILEVLELRLEKLGDKKENILKLLNVCSIFDNDFKRDHLQVMMKSIEIEPLLFESCKHSFLTKSNHFRFSIPFLKEYFNNKLIENPGTYAVSKEYSMYLKKNEPENYFTRAYYLQLCNEYDEYTIDIFGLFSLAYFRSSEIPFGKEAALNIEKHLKDLTNNFESDSLKKMFKDFEHLKTAYELYRSQKYEDALNELNTITDNDSFLLLSEIKRVRLLILLMESKEVSKIEIAVSDLENTITILKQQQETEQLLKCQFVLFSTYSNKLDEFQKSHELGLEINTLLGVSPKNELFKHFKYVFFRKSCVYLSDSISKARTSDSVAYFEEIEDWLECYLAFCNYAGSQIVLGEYTSAIQSLNSCFQLVKDHKSISFPSINKVHNNHILAELLNDLKDVTLEEKQVTKKALKKFEELLSDGSYEASAIIEINKINLQIMIGDFRDAEVSMKKIKSELLRKNQHTFYLYYLSNLDLCFHIMQKNWPEAERSLHQLRSNFPTYHTKNKKIIELRNEALGALIEEKRTGSPRELDQWVKKEVYGDKDNEHFYYRLFLFSDLQFTSI